MIDTKALVQTLGAAGMQSWADCVEKQLYRRLAEKPHGDMPKWRQALLDLPLPETNTLLLDQGAVQVGLESDTTLAQRAALQDALMQLHPWRKGPFRLHGVHVDTEWRSDWKWDRLAPHVAPLQGRKVLDVGCGNGYHCWRVAGAGAKLVIGIDPTQLFHMQFEALQRLFAMVPGSGEILRRVIHLPLGIEDVPPSLGAFDSVFSMGVLYHRRSPIDHLQELRDALRPEGELVLETLVVEGDRQEVLVPEGRYAKMRNVWFIPSVSSLETWLRRAGLRNVRTVDVTPTSMDEQRTTPWMQFESLADYLDPFDRGRTVEGYPAPRRAIVLANA